MCLSEDMGRGMARGTCPALCPETAAKGSSLQTWPGQGPVGQGGEGPAGAGARWEGREDRLG